MAGSEVMWLVLFLLVWQNFYAVVEAVNGVAKLLHAVVEAVLFLL